MDGRDGNRADGEPEEGSADQATAAESAAESVVATGAVDQPERGPRDWRELITVLLLSVTAILTAWTGFQASKWGGAMSISFSQASGARIEAGRLDAAADRKLTIQVQLFTPWLQAYQADDDELAAFLEERFPEPLQSAFPVWLASEPLKNPEAAPTP